MNRFASRRALVSLALSALALISAPSMNAQSRDEAKPAPSASRTNRNARLNHVVSFKFKDAATKDQVKEVEEAFRTLKTKIPQIQRLVWGLNNSPEGLNKGFTHCWVLTFATEADRDAYLVHPDHKEFGKLVKPVIADVFVVDFWAKD
jgi:hypothetical protein